jgi:hypothetical protein
MPDAVANRKRQMRGAGNKPKWTNEASWPEAAEGLFSASQVAVNPGSNCQKTVFRSCDRRCFIRHANLVSVPSAGNSDPVSAFEHIPESGSVSGPPSA